LQLVDTILPIKYRHCKIFFCRNQKCCNKDIFNQFWPLSSY